MRVWKLMSFVVALPGVGICYINAMLNVTDYILQIMSNDASEFGVRFIKDF